MNACTRGGSTCDLNRKGGPHSVLLHCRQVGRSGDVAGCFEYVSDCLNRKDSLTCFLLRNDFKLTEMRNGPSPTAAAQFFAKIALGDETF